MEQLYSTQLYSTPKGPDRCVTLSKDESNENWYPNAQTRNTTPYEREEQKGEKRCMTIQTTNRHEKTQSFLNRFWNTLT